MITDEVLRSYVLLDWYLNARYDKVIGGTGVFRKARNRVHHSPWQVSSKSIQTLFRNARVLETN